MLYNINQCIPLSVLYVFGHTKQELYIVGQYTVFPIIMQVNKFLKPSCALLHHITKYGEAMHCYHLGRSTSTDVKLSTKSMQLL